MHCWEASIAVGPQACQEGTLDANKRPSWQKPEDTLDTAAAVTHEPQCPSGMAGIITLSAVTGRLAAPASSSR